MSNKDDHDWNQKQLEEKEMWENHLRRKRELERLLDEMGVPHTKLSDRHE